MHSTIVIPTYQREAQIGRAVEAALSQSAGDAAVVVVDDGSTDATRAVCSAWFGHPRFNYILLSANGGTAVAKNAALALCPFDAITFHDSDDLPARDKVLRQQRTMQRGDIIADPCLPWSLAGRGQQPGSIAEIDIVLTAHELIAADGSRHRVARTLSLVDDIFPNLQFAAGPLGDWVLINSGLFHRRVFARIGGYRDSVEEDRDLRNRALFAGCNIWFIDEVLLTKYEEPDSLTAARETGYRSDRRRADRERLWATLAEWRRGALPSAVPIDLAGRGVAFASAPERLSVCTDIPVEPATARRLQADLEALR